MCFLGALQHKLPLERRVISELPCWRSGIWSRSFPLTRGAVLRRRVGTCTPWTA